MAKFPAENLEVFLKGQDPSTLVAVLVELAGDHQAVQQRLARMQLADRPERLAAGFRKTLSAWRRSTKFYDYHNCFRRTLPPRWRFSRPSSRPALRGTSAPTIPTVASETRSVLRAAIGCKQRPAAGPRPANGRSGSPTWLAPTNTARERNCCAVPTCCSTSLSCAGSSRDLRR